MEFPMTAVRRLQPMAELKSVLINYSVSSGKSAPIALRCPSPLALSPRPLPAPSPRAIPARGEGARTMTAIGIGGRRLSAV